MTIKKFYKHFDPRSLGRDREWLKKIASEQFSLSKKMFGYCKDISQCPICESHSKEEYTVVYGYPYFECKNCGHIYCSKLLDNNSIRNLYDGESENKTLQNSIYLEPGIFEKRVKAVAHDKVKFIVDVLGQNNLTMRGTWLDIGCGAGEMLYLARELGWSVRGIESDKEESDFVKSMGIEVDTAYLDVTNCKDLLRGVSLVSTINVLEHIVDPNGFLKMITNALEDVIVVFEVPRHPSISSLSSKLDPNMAYRHIYPPDHLHIFSDQSISLMLKNSNLEIIGRWNFGQDAFDLFQTIACVSDIKENSFLKSILDLCPDLQRVIDENNLSDTSLIITKSMCK